MADRITAEYTFNDMSAKKSTRNLPYLSASATNNQIKALVNGLNELTTNTLIEINRVETTDITTAAPKNILEIENFLSFTMAEIKEAVTEKGAFYTSALCEGVPESWHGSGNFTMFFVKSPYQWLVATAYFNVDALTLAVKINGYAGEETTGEFVIYLPETDETAAVTINVPISDE